MISSRPQLDVAEEAQLALYKFFKAVDSAAKEYTRGGLERLDIQVVDGQFSFSWRFHSSERGQKIENWSDLRFIPKD